MAVSGDQYELVHDDQRLVAVEVGGGLRTYTVGGRPVLDGFGEDELCPAAAGQLLAPWPGRLAGGRYAFEGATHQAALDEPEHGNAIHGLVRWLRWEPLERSNDAVTLRTVLPAQPGYPQPLELTTTYRLDGAGLTAEHTATNTGGAAVPFGFGAHPYLMHPDRAVDELVLGLPAERTLVFDEHRIPVGETGVAEAGLDFRKPAVIGDRVIDATFTGLERDNDGRSSVSLAVPDGPVLTVWADLTFRWIQIFTADTIPGNRHRRAVAIEPMTCPGDAFHSQRDLLVLEPGQTWRGVWGITLSRPA
jgi:aldose 1-epimerase